MRWMCAVGLFPSTSFPCSSIRQMEESPASIGLISRRNSAVSKARDVRTSSENIGQAQRFDAARVADLT